MVINLGAILGRYDTRNDRSDLNTFCADQIKDCLAIVLMRPMMWVGFLLGAYKVMSADELNARAVNLLVIINRTI